MPWTIVADADYAAWFLAQRPAVREAIAGRVILLGSEGPNLGRPAADTLHGTAMANLKELRVPAKGQVIRILFAFDPKRQAILLVGGDKRGDGRWYTDNIPIAEARYARHLEALRLRDEVEANEQGKGKT